MDKKYPYLDVGKRLEKLRKNLTQAEFAKKIGISLRTYQYYESGERLPPDPVLERIAEECNTTKDEILGRGFASLERLFAQEKAKIAAEKAELEGLEKKLRDKLLEWGIPVPENTLAFLEVVTFYNKHGINIVELIKGAKEPIHTGEEQELIDMLVAILRGENEDNKKAIIENVKAFYKTRNVNIPNEIKKANHAG